jgi:hypothetical protein
MSPLRTVFSTPRPVPSRRIPALAGSALVLVCLPLFIAAGWPLSAWGLAAALWAAGEALAFAVARVPLGVDNLAASGVAGLGMTFRAMAVMIVLLIVATQHRHVALAAGLIYIAAYSLELAFSLAVYFVGSRR